MLKKISKLLLLAFVVLVLIVLVRTWRFTKPIEQTKAETIPALPDAAAQHLSAAIQIKTISLSDTLPTDTAAFMQFSNFLEQAYPLVHQHLQRTIINNFSYAYYWKGKDSTLKPYILMAHQDVVPVEAATKDKWTVPPFSGKITDTAIWGRGAVDDKGSLISIMEAAEKLLQQQYQPQRGIYLCFGHDEELGGRHGAAEIANWMKQNHIQPALVCDEGGIISKDNFRETGRPVALLGVAEKGYVSFQLTVEKEGGHSSMPAKETAIDILSKALVNVRSRQMPARFTQPTLEMLQKLGPIMPFATRMVLANLWLFKLMLKSKFEKSPAMNASIHTTIVPTIFNAGIKDNMIPTRAQAVINSRILPGTTSEEVMQFMQTEINDDRIKIKGLPWGSEAGKNISTESEGFKKIASISYKLMDNIIPVPFLMIGATDSRHFRSFVDEVINFTPMLDPQGFHGIDERIKISDLQRMVFYYETFMRKS